MKKAALLLSIFLFQSVMSASESFTTYLYVGTYTRTTSKGIYRVGFDPATGMLGEPVLVAERSSPTWVEFSPDRQTLYAVDAANNGAAAYSVNATTGALTLLNTGGSDGGSPCHLSVDASSRMLFAANYGSGTVASWSLNPDGSIGKPGTFVQLTGKGPNEKRQEKAHAHEVKLSPDQRFLFVCDLGTDLIRTYKIDPATTTFTEHTPAAVKVAPGSGPRHLTFSPEGRHAYAITEMGSTVIAFDYDPASGLLTEIQTISTIPADFKQNNQTAEIEVSADGRFVYGSNRGHNSIVVYSRDAATGKLTLVDITASGGNWPRHFKLSPDGRWLVCANETSGDIFVFAVDPSSGKLSQTAARALVPMPVCVVFAP